MSWRKQITVLFIIIIGTFQLFAQGDEVIINTPQKTKAGNEFLIVISVPANKYQGVVRLNFELPNGFSANSKKKANADFEFSNQVASFKWLKFPQNQVVELSMTVTTQPTIEGYFVIRPKVSYLKNNEPVRNDLFPQIITVEPGEFSETDWQEHIDETKVTFEEFKSEGIACIRQVPYLEQGEVVVNLLVSKGELNKYGKIQEKIPEGYKVENIRSKNAIFVFNQSQNIVKYMWMSMPEQPKFVVSYKLTPIKDIDDDQPFIIYGSFYYAQNNKTERVDIQERGIVFEEPE